MNNFLQRKYQKTVDSIAFYPAIIAIGFLALCGLMITVDYSEQGKLIKSQLHWLRLKDASTARSIISAVASGIISLTVFSFSMVMIVLNQAASQMSNRVLGQLIGNKFQQIVLGIYIGTIIYAFFLLSTIRDIDSGIYIPALSTYLLIFLTIFDIFLFIYFLHYITQSVKYEVVIQRIFDDTLDSLKKACPNQNPYSVSLKLSTPYTIKAAKSGIFEGIEKTALKSLCIEHAFQAALLVTPGTFILTGTPVIATNKNLPEELQTKLLDLVIIPLTETINGNFFYGFNQLREIALKALSPGINDPGTAIISLRALSSLIMYRASHFPENTVLNDQGSILIILPEISFERIAAESINPIWDYGKNDRLICKEFYLICSQLKTLTAGTVFDQILNEISVKRLLFSPASGQ
ncbi:DUF2254 domain-containing protein [Dyadobacter psychrotolerans]|uniref:DUF2254 domain-containing protein n=1 Tax=Dyadobacter psychrotolerans TaxID=2541721 RepID=A0A4R5E219_9BACT|nr:DUF2254 domain-containing protein [Dyadobacter psychrotolerans]TDE18013.1 DUF2254 domain-containing protein [Dyadobacter psychrotolerans]